MRRVCAGLVVVIALGALLASGTIPGASTAPATLPDRTPPGIHKIRHVVIIMQENRSFDSYSRTYPGADGIAGLAGNHGGVPWWHDPHRGHCGRAYHDAFDTNYGGPHTHASATADMGNGRMNGFIVQAEIGKARSCEQFDAPWCSRHRK